MNLIDATLVRAQAQYFIDAGAFKVRLPEAFHTHVENYAGGKVVFGVRPEDMAAQASAAEAGTANTLTARAEVVETLGAETFVYLTCGPHSIVARMEAPERPLSVGETLQVELKMAKTHLFDGETSRTIV
jgi:multiple sugar transport system ATP-binding protein